ncbi:hypothetical protein FE810_02545 [Thalassotalea litorea]|uniref:Uncharacterized protein n=1 Tax=Thalassotalea litorea TaxID=2020715 RepID=A0A5R9IRT2_9GAMM|nr:hypothetical protein [Thalassotalea litorea]TLU67183.1 hypothetical protein FE810_02545 [Thalassotalea litorea]
MDIIRLISKLPILKQAYQIKLSPYELTGENLITRKVLTIKRSSTHPRSLAGDFFDLEKDIKQVMQGLAFRSWVKPSVLICLEGLDEGGYTNIEKTGIKEATMGAGAMDVYLAEQPIDYSTAYEVLVKGNDINPKSKD